MEFSLPFSKNNKAVGFLISWQQMSNIAQRQTLIFWINLRLNLYCYFPCQHSCGSTFRDSSPGHYAEMWSWTSFQLCPMGTSTFNAPCLSFESILMRRAFLLSKGDREGLPFLSCYYYWCERSWFWKIGSWFQIHDVLGLFCVNICFLQETEGISDYLKDRIAIVLAPGVAKTPFWALLSFPPLLLKTAARAEARVGPEFGSLSGWVVFRMEETDLEVSYLMIWND